MKRLLYGVGLMGLLFLNTLAFGSMFSGWQDWWGVIPSVVVGLLLLSMLKEGKEARKQKG